jgi:hypothetical protein
MRFPQPLSRLLLLAAFALAAVGCSKVNMENYARLKTGQSYDEVVAILGKPARCDEMLGVRQCIWGEEKQGPGITVGFVGTAALTMSANNLK